MECPLCRTDGETVVWQDASCRVIRVDDDAYPGFCRVIWHDHVAEMTDLPAERQAHLLAVVLATERALRDTMSPVKVNLASFGNMVPHLHWHVIPRFSDDPHFPESIWGIRQRQGVPRPQPDTAQLAQQIAAALGATAPN